MVKITRPKILLIAIVLITLSTVGYFAVTSRNEIAWVAEAFLGSAEPYFTATIDGTSVGNAETSSIDKTLTSVGEELKTKTFTLTKGDGKWGISLQDLGITFDKAETLEKIKQQSTLGFWDRLSLALSQGSSRLTIPLGFDLNVSKCSKALSNIKIPYTGPKNASAYYDGGVKIKKGADGEQFRPEVTCNAILATVGGGQYSSEVKMFTTGPEIKTSYFEAILPKINGIVSNPVTLTYGSNYWTVSSGKLFSFLTFRLNKDKSALNIGWSDSKLNSYIGGIAAVTNSDNPTPKLGNCETLLWIGGYRLDETGTKNIIESLRSDSSRSYNLKVDYFSSSTKKITKVHPGNKTIYLTYDDGMIYSDQIMDIAACYGIKVTFFAIGQRASIDKGPMKRAIAMGDAVQSHGFDHDPYGYATAHSYSWQYNDIQQSINAITAVTEVRPTYFRPPGGNKNADTYKAAAANNIKVILWGVTSIDTKYTSPSHLCQNILGGALPGRTVLSHSTKSATVAALPCVIEGLARAGYTMAVFR